MEFKAVLFGTEPGALGHNFCGCLFVLIMGSKKLTVRKGFVTMEFRACGTADLLCWDCSGVVDVRVL